MCFSWLRYSGTLPRVVILAELLQKTTGLGLENFFICCIDRFFTTVQNVRRMGVSFLGIWRTH